MLKSYKELIAWQKAYQLCLDVYEKTKRFPKDETYGLTSQIRRAAVSVPSNIAEGYGRKTRGEYVHSLYLAYGSLCELETQIMIAKDVGYVSKNDYESFDGLLTEVSKLLLGLIHSLQN